MTRGTMKALLLGAAALAGAAGVAAGVWVVAQDGEQEEVVQEPPSATASVPATETPLESPTKEPVGTMAVTATPGETLTYTDATYGYSFEYPANWIVSPGKGAGTVTALYSYDPADVPPEQAGLPVPKDKLKAEIVVLDNSEGLSLRDWIGRDRMNGAPIKVVSSGNATVGAKPGIVETVELAEGGTAMQ